MLLNFSDFLQHTYILNGVGGGINVFRKGWSSLFTRSMCFGNSTMFSLGNVTKGSRSSLRSVCLSVKWLTVFRKTSHLSMYRVPSSKPKPFLFCLLDVLDIAFWNKAVCVVQLGAQGFIINLVFLWPGWLPAPAWCFCFSTGEMKW